MREIKFRAWDKSKKWMVYDVQDAYDGLWSERNSDEVNDYYGYVSTFQSFTDEEIFNFMQYTGLKDKNGVEIYEGDIIKAGWHERYKAVVIWKENSVRFIGEVIGEKAIVYVDMVDKYDISAVEVIGNIYENPELI